MILAGHSERRMLFAETNQVVKTKVDKILEAEAVPVFCCGETLEVRNANQQNKTVLEQLEESLFHLSETDFTKVIIAYEPVWAIGTGVVATPEQAEEMHRFIRLEIVRRYGESVAEKTKILYGGSVKPDNARQLLKSPHIDGALVGGASLKSDDFLAIVNAAN
jgi:triosephosphate isomerase